MTHNVNMTKYIIQQYGNEVTSQVTVSTEGAHISGCKGGHERKKIVVKHCFNVLQPRYDSVLRTYDNYSKRNFLCVCVCPGIG